MADATMFDMLLTFFIIAGIFLMAYMAYRQQGILETVNEIKEAFEDKVEDAKAIGEIYK